MNLCVRATALSRCEWNRPRAKSVVTPGSSRMASSHASGTEPLDDVRRQLTEQRPIFGGEENVLTMIAAQCDVLEGTGHMQSEWAAFPCG
jgi:hypothetical protein